MQISILIKRQRKGNHIGQQVHALKGRTMTAQAVVFTQGRTRVFAGDYWFVLTKTRPW